MINKRLCCPAAERGTFTNPPPIGSLQKREKGQTASHMRVGEKGNVKAMSGNAIESRKGDSDPKARVPEANDLSVTFQWNRDVPIYTWFPYVEGFSGKFVEQIIQAHEIREGNLILDPYAGSGTTAVTATMRGIDSMAVDVNPFMCFVTSVKTRLDIFEEKMYSDVFEISRQARRISGPERIGFLEEGRFFPPGNLNQLLKLRDAILALPLEPPERDLYLLALASIAIEVSNMARHTDLRYRRSENSEKNVFQIFVQRATRYVDDLNQLDPVSCECAVINDDICNPSRIPSKFHEEVDYLITSPPYLNGTNYIRNTKLELALLGMIETGNDLTSLHKALITGGINSVKWKPTEHIFPFVEEVCAKLSPVAYDRRIPQMVREYFSDMFSSFQTIDSLLSQDARGYVVVGDSRYAGVAIPTDRFIEELCKIVGWEVPRVTIARTRRSKDGGLLRESVIQVHKC